MERMRMLCNNDFKTKLTSVLFFFVASTDLSSSTGWCQLAYWELTERVGRLFPVENLSVNVFSDQPRGDGLCLTTLAQQKHTLTPDAVLKARQKIGLGELLTWIFPCFF
jgi:mothers against decapentaplegic homolog 6